MRKAIISIVLIVELIHILVFVFIIFVMPNEVEEKNRIYNTEDINLPIEEEPLTLTKTIKEQEINKIKIITTNENITIKSSDDKNIKLTYYLMYNYNENDETSLFMLEKENNETILKLDLDSFQDMYVEEMLLEIPKTMVASLDIDSLNGALEIADIIMGDVIYHTSNGEATMKNITTNTLYMEGTNGSLDFSNIETKSLILNCMNTEIEGNIVGTMNDYQLNLHTINNIIIINNQEYGESVKNSSNSEKIVDIGTYNADIVLTFENIE